MLPGVSVYRNCSEIWGYQCGDAEGILRFAQCRLVNNYKHFAGTMIFRHVGNYLSVKKARTRQKTRIS